MSERRLVTEIRKQVSSGKARYVVAGMVLLCGLSCLASGDSSETVKRQARKYQTSELAQRVESLLDRKAHGAAEGILNARLREHPDDAGLHVQYARYILLAHTPHHPGFIQTPLYQMPNAHWAPYVAIEAAERASQLDPEAAPYAAAVLMTSVRDRAAQSLQKGEGVIGNGVWQFVGDTHINLNGLQSSSLVAGWRAHKIHPATAAAYQDDFRELMEQAIGQGKVASAAMLGNLVGSLASNEEDNTRDFVLACDAFHRALENYQPSQKESSIDWIERTACFFRTGIFAVELEAAGKGQTPQEYLRLEQELNRRGYAILESSEFKQAMERKEMARRAEEERRRRETQAPRIAQLKKDFVRAVYADSQQEELQIAGWFPQQIRNALTKKGGPFMEPGSEAYRAERELRQMGASLAELRNDPRIGWVLSDGSDARSAWSTQRRFGLKPEDPGRVYTQKMERYLSPVMVHRRVFSHLPGFDENRTSALTSGVNEVIRYDTETDKYLIRAAGLPAARKRAMDAARGSFWMTTLAEMAQAVEEDKAIVFDEAGQQLEFGEQGLVGYLHSMDSHDPGNASLSSEERIYGRKPGIDFTAVFPKYIASVRAGKDPATGLDKPEPADNPRSIRERSLRRRGRRRRQDQPTMISVPRSLARLRGTFFQSSDDTPVALTFRFGLPLGRFLIAMRWATCRG